VEAPAATADTEPGAGEEPAPAEAVPAGDPEFSTEAPQSGTAEAPGSESGKSGEPAMPITSAEPAVAPEMPPAEAAQAPVETPAAVTPAT